MVKKICIKSHRGGGRLELIDRIFSGCKIKKICYNSDMEHHISNKNFKGKFCFTISTWTPQVTTFKNIRRCAFTLAEVLITLGIIGVVAAMTMPVLIQNSKEKEYTAKLKKFNSVMNQALMMAINENGMIEDWGLATAGMTTEPTDEEREAGNKSINLFWDRVSPYLKLVSRCNYGDDSCANKYDRESLDGTAFSKFTPRLVFADGTTIVGTTVSSGTCSSVVGTSKMLQNVCGQLFIDLNGPKPPNATGKDVFLFYFTKYGIVPMGTAEETSYSLDKYCNLSKKNSLNGYGCAAWVITNENMDYLHCNDLSWHGKTKCK